MWRVTPLQSGRTPQDQADLYAAILDTLDIERAVVLGFSSGGPSAVHFAARYPDRTTSLFLDTAILLPFKPPFIRAPCLARRVLRWSPAGLRDQ